MLQWPSSFDKAAIGRSQGTLRGIDGFSSMEYVVPPEDGTSGGVSAGEVATAV